MFKLKRQAKNLTPLHLFFGLLLTICLATVVIPSPQSSSQTATPSTASADIELHSLSILPTQAPVTPIPLTIETIFNPPTASSSANTESDFCLSVPILVYHHVQPMPVATKLGHSILTVDSSIFESQIKYLKDNGYTALSADGLVTALIERQSLPEKSVMITVDDGYDDNYTYAFLIAKKYQFQMNFMIPTRLINTPGYMNWDHLREMRDNEYASLYNHTATHAPLGYISKSQIENELQTSTEDFQKELGMNIHIFTYPYGSYNPQAIESLKTHGFKAAFTTDDGREQCVSNLMLLKRTRIGNAPMASYDF